MIDTTTETIITLSQASRRQPKFNGKHPHPSTVWRWCTKGIDGVHLEHIKVGGRMCTSVEALDRFFNRDVDKTDFVEPPDRMNNPPAVSTRLVEVSNRLQLEGI